MGKKGKVEEEFFYYLSFNRSYRQQLSILLIFSFRFVLRTKKKEKIKIRLNNFVIIGKKMF